MAGSHDWAGHEERLLEASAPIASQAEAVDPGQAFAPVLGVEEVVCGLVRDEGGPPGGGADAGIIRATGFPQARYAVQVDPAGRPVRQKLRAQLDRTD